MANKTEPKRRGPGRPAIGRRERTYRSTNAEQLAITGVYQGWLNMTPQAAQLALAKGEWCPVPAAMVVGSTDPQIRALIDTRQKSDKA